MTKVTGKKSSQSRKQDVKSSTDKKSNHDYHDHDKIVLEGSTYPRTDLGNAEYFARKYRGKVKYNFTKKKWLLWKSPLWHVDNKEEVVQLVKAATRERREQAEHVESLSERTKEIQWTLNSESDAKVKSTLSLSRSEPFISTHAEDWDQDDYLIGTPTGVVDLRTGNLLPPSPKHLIALKTSVPYQQDAKASRWEQFLTEVWPEKELRDYVSRCVGYSLTGDTTEQCLFALFGSGANGKSVFLEVLKKTLGDYAYTMPFSALEFQDRNGVSNDIATLANRRFVAASETQENVRLNEARIKMLTGNEEITARFLRKEYFSFRPTAKYWVAFNHKPRVMDDTFGFWRRMRLIDFQQTFTESKDDKNLQRKLMKERPGILAWAVEQCLKWQKEGLRVPVCVVEATNQYKKESNPLTDFIDDFLEFDERKMIAKSDLYDEYRSNVIRQGDRFPLSSKGFSQRLLSMGVKDARIGDARTRVWIGVGLRGHSGLYDIEIARKNGQIKHEKKK